jgi:hypothetical protein
MNRTLQGSSHEISYAGWNPYRFECRPATARLEPDGKVASFPRTSSIGCYEKSDLLHSLGDNRWLRGGIRVSGSRRVIIDQFSTRLSLVQERA